MHPAEIPGYQYGSSSLRKSPISMSELAQLKETVLFTGEDARWLKQAGEVLENQIEDVLDVWYGFVGSHPHLLDHFCGADGKPDSNYLQRVRLRFGQWIRDTCRAEYDQAWLDYQAEIAVRHTAAGKNRTDNVKGKTGEVPLQFVIALIYPITATIKPFLAKRGHAADEVDKMHQAWFKSVVLQIALWSQAYVKGGTAMR